MSKPIIYSTGCPQCRILEMQLQKKGIEYDVVSDVAVMQEKGFMSMPILEIDGATYVFQKALQWIKERG
ncbi:MAG: hypothetical protein PUF04_09795 [bacterium]|nr:hypothetical protein [bacterium]